MQDMNLECAVAAARGRGRVSGYDAERRCVAATLGEEPCKPIGGRAETGHRYRHGKKKEGWGEKVALSRYS